MMKAIKTPAGNHLFEVDEACVKLCERDNIIIHRLVEKILFLSKRTRPDIQPTIAFLATRVRNSEEKDWKKLRRVLIYLDATINSMKLHFNVNNLKVVQ